MVRVAIGQAVAPIDDSVGQLVAESTFVLEGDRFAAKDLPALLAGESDPARRARLLAAFAPVVTQAVKLRRPQSDLAYAVAKRLGYPNYLSLLADMQQLDVRGAGSLAHRLLDHSDAVSLAAMRGLVPQVLGYSLDDLGEADLPRLTRAPGLEHWFPAERLIETTAKTLAGLGVDLAALPVKIDLTRAGHKDPRPRCFVGIAPGDIRVSVAPVGGAADYEGLLGEMGQAVSFSFSRAELLEFQRLGDETTSEAFARLFAGLTANPEWLADMLDMGEPDRTLYLRLAALKKLLSVRRLAAQVVLGVEVYGALVPIADAAALYATVMGRALGLALDERAFERYQIEADVRLTSAVHLRAELLAAQLSTLLRQRFGVRWWRRGEAGAFLRELWASGRRDTGEELARKLGFAAIDPSAMLRGVALAIAEAPPPMLRP